MPLLLIIIIICDAAFTYYAASKAIGHGFTIIINESIVTHTTNGTSRLLLIKFRFLHYYNRRFNKLSNYSKFEEKMLKWYF